MHSTDFLAAYNFNFNRASRVADLLISYAEAHANALAAGAEIIDLRDKPNAQPSYALKPEVAQAMRDAGERVPRRVSPKTVDESDLIMSKVPGYRTTVTRTDVVAALNSIRALHAQARVIARMGGDERVGVVGQTVLDNQRAAVDALAALDPSLFTEATREFDKAHVPGFDESTALGVFGFHWTASNKGDATTVRYDTTRTIGTNSKAEQASSAYVPVSLDEHAMAEALAA